VTLTDIVVHGASEHNLRAVDVTIPRLALTTITGVSGSGKSSLAFDTIYREGQRRYVESLSAYARQFLGRMEKPRVERIDGLSPALLIDQKTVNRNPRSTVGTITEIHDHLRLLWARLGQPHCPVCDAPVTGQDTDTIVETLLARYAGRRLAILAPVVRDRKGEYRADLEGWRLKGHARAYVDGVERRLDEPIPLARNVRHTIELVTDRLRPEPARRARVAEAVEAAVALADGLVSVRTEDGEPTHYSTLNTCPEGHGDFPELEPRLFSFNSPHGACPDCDGLGRTSQPDPDKLVADPTRSIRDGALRIMDRSGYMGYVRLGPRSLATLAQTFDIDLDRPWQDLPERARRLLMYGSGRKQVTLEWAWRSSDSRTVVKGKDTKPFEGILPALERAQSRPGHGAVERFFSSATCRACGGSRLNAPARAVRFRERPIAELLGSTVEQALAWLSGLELRGREALVGTQLVREACHRLGFLAAVGLPYLRLDRGARTLSGGESQRVRLASQVGSGLQGVLYVLDEPSIGLHARDNGRLIDTLHALRDRGNTVLVVEHDEATIRASDAVVDIGPGAGPAGGRVLAAGPLPDVLSGAPTPTTDYLCGRRAIEVPAVRRPGNGHALTVEGARQFNLADLTVAFPLGCLVAVTGVSGSGKSTLVDMVLRRALARRLHKAEQRPGEHSALRGIEHIDKVVEIDQLPIGRTPRSNPATYTGVMDLLRDVYAGTPEARVRGYRRGRFSFNVHGGRCEECQGAGVNTIEMQFLPSVEVPCETCEGRRYNTETLEIQYRGRSIEQVLELTVDEALAFFEHHARMARILQTLHDVGLGYVRLGQTSTTLSGGEAQRMKLASELCRPATGRTLYILDEPTTGLHFEDVRVLLSALQRLIDAGNSMIVVEHNLDVIKVADWLIDLGPEGGAGGGRLVAQGTPEQVAQVTASHTGRALAEALAPARRALLGRRKAGKPPGSGRVGKARAARTGRDLYVKGASLHNLQHVDVTVPHGKLTVVTGPSGSGKTSLAFDTIFAEGQRRFVESLSTYARRFLERMDRPPVDSIDGLAPAIAIDQKTASRNPRSTVATTTELHDYLRILFARVGQPHCWTCGRELRAWSPTAAAQDLITHRAGARVLVTAPLWSADHSHRTVLSEPGELRELVPELRKDGFLRVLLDGCEERLQSLPDGTPRRSIELVVDRTTVDKRRRSRLADALAQAQQRGLGLARVVPADAPDTAVDYESRAACARCGNGLPGDLTPRMFSFNSHAGACQTCEGLGQLRVASEARLIDRPERPLLDGAMTSRVGRFLVRPDGGHAHVIRRLAERFEVDLRLPWARLPAAFREAVLRGRGVREPVAVSRRSASAGRTRQVEREVAWDGMLAIVEGWWRGADGEGWWGSALDALLEVGPCPACRGGRLQPAALATTVGGHGPADLAGLTVEDARAFFARLTLDAHRARIAEDVLREIRNRLAFLVQVGLGYLTLDRAASTLSGGEAQRIRLASQLGNRLVGVLYVLDEPSIGLHPRDQDQLLDTLRELRDLGNTIVVVEHDQATIEAADHVLDIGPGAGTRGGRVVAAGTPAHVRRARGSITGQYLSGRRRIPVPATRREPAGRLDVRDAHLHNLQHLDLGVPLGVLTAVTGVSGSGKSTLVSDLLVPAVQARLDGRRAAPAGLGGLAGAAPIERLLVIDQSPLGRSPSSNAATYSGAFDDIRALFAGTPEARMRGFAAGRFSVNVAAGRCEACQGRGVEVVEMHFLSDVELPCESCRGRRYNRATLEVRWKGRSIADVLETEIGAARELFSAHARIEHRLALLEDVGLGYLKLGQPATTLSGGEAQRVKLAAELGRPGTGRALIVLDEPTTGLHFEDVARLVGVLQRMVEQGNTVVVIEHNMDVVKNADWVIDLGPEGGREGGRLVAAGTPEAVAKARGSHTGRYLRAALGAARA
jgi:excinuclease ABC subunit A